MKGFMVGQKVIVKSTNVIFEVCMKKDGYYLLRKQNESIKNNYIHFTYKQLMTLCEKINNSYEG